MSRWTGGRYVTAAPGAVSKCFSPRCRRWTVARWPWEVWSQYLTARWRCGTLGHGAQRKKTAGKRGHGDTGTKLGV